jgi:hypothetical protein
LEEKRNDRFVDTAETGLGTLDSNVGGGGGQQTELVKLTVFMRDLEVLKSAKTGKLKMGMADDFCLELRNTQSRLIPYLKDAKRRGII